MVKSTGESGGMWWLSLMVDFGQVPPEKGHFKPAAEAFVVFFLSRCFIHRHIICLWFHYTLRYIELYIQSNNMECLVWSCLLNGLAFFQQTPCVFHHGRDMIRFVLLCYYFWCNLKVAWYLNWQDLQHCFKNITGNIRAFKSSELDVKMQISPLINIAGALRSHLHTGHSIDRLPIMVRLTS